MSGRERGTPGGAAAYLTFDGRPIPFTPGQSIGAALVAAGIRSWRTTRGDGRPRGLFCGIGVCFDCLVTVDGRGSLRACMVEARPGDDVRSSAGAQDDQDDQDDAEGGPE